ncbi:hypothetical protein HPP92_019926 [Vanilla planifolia]|uniref:Uncharacterized protein n=1 Tax=Vanilla planifolia TaxID=51239 RepID=A0A835QDF3_VANPL|nr:hypothetical protein HPP92_019926 [Vanilla planifolia]
MEEFHRKELDLSSSSEKLKGSDGIDQTLGGSFPGIGGNELDGNGVVSGKATPCQVGMDLLDLFDAFAEFELINQAFHLKRTGGVALQRGTWRQR